MNKEMVTNITVAVDINIKDLPNLIALENINLSSFNDEGIETILNTYPVGMFTKRVAHESYITVNIPSDLFSLLVGFKKVNIGFHNWDL